jgi:hypothetical protein
MKVTYHGPHDEIEIPSLGVVVKKGGTFEADDEVGKRLLEQPANFKAATAGKKETE